MNKKHTIGAAIVGAVAGSAVGIASFGPGLAGAIVAQDETVPTSPDAIESQANEDPAPNGGRLGQRHRGERSTVIADLLGITQEELHEALRDGQTLAEVAEAKGVSRDSLIAAMKAKHQEHLDAAVADDRLTAEQAAERSAKFAENIDAIIDGEHNGHHGRRGPRGHKGPGLDRGEIAELFDMAPEELREALAGGQSLADVAQAAGIETQTLVDAIVADIEEKMAEKVDAGRITQQQADTMLEDAADRVEARVNGDVPEGGFGRGHGPGHRPGRGGDTNTGEQQPA